MGKAYIRVTKIVRKTKTHRTSNAAVEKVNPAVSIPKIPSVKKGTKVVKTSKSESKQRRCRTCGRYL